MTIFQTGISRALILFGFCFSVYYNMHVRMHRRFFMNVSIKFRTGEVLRGIRSGEYVLPEGCTIDQALDAAVSENGMTLADHDREYLFALLNNRQVQMDNVLKDGDSVWILFKILGG